MNAITVSSLTKKYKNGVMAIDGLDLSVNQGEVFSLLGENGAGKSSLIHILTTFYKPTSGQVTILGSDLEESPNKIRAKIACVAQRTSIDSHLTLMENMLFQSRMYGIKADVGKKRIANLIERFNLSPYVNYPVASYSGGIKRKLDIAMNLVSQPQILFLDEPTVGLDTSARITLWNMVKQIKEEYGTTIFLTTHYLEEAETLSDTIYIMKKGKKVVQGTPKELRQYIQQNIVSVTFGSIEEANKYRSVFLEEQFSKEIYIKKETVFLKIEEYGDIFRVLNKWLLDKDIPFRSIQKVESTLEDVFLSFTKIKEGEEK